MAEKNNAKLPDIATLLQAGIDPKTGLPLRLSSGSTINKDLKYKARRIFRIMDEQRAVNRYQWYNLPEGITSQELERLLYFKYSLVFFYMKELNKFFFMPYALDGTIDFYGRFNTVHPVPMTSGAEKEEQTAEYKQKAALLSTLKLDIVKDVVVDLESINEELLTKSGVILRDYTNQLGQLGEARWILNDDLIEAEADCIPFMRVNMLLGTGIQALRVNTADAASQVDAVSRAFYKSALDGNPYIALTSTAEFQELQPTSTYKVSEYFLALQSLDNILLSTHGIENAGAFEKKSHVLESENQVNATNVTLPLQDGLSQRQNFCNIVNSIWGLNIWCEINETLLGYDVDGDGVSYEENDNGAGSGEEVSEQGGQE